MTYKFPSSRRPPANPLQIAAKLYETREAAQFLLGDSYAKTMKEYGEIVQGFATRNGLSVLDAARQIAGDKNLNGQTMMLVLASAVELLEPSAPPQKPAGK